MSNSKVMLSLYIRAETRRASVFNGVPHRIVPPSRTYRNPCEYNAASMCTDCHSLVVIPFFLGLNRLHSDFQRLVGLSFFSSAQNSSDFTFVSHPTSEITPPPNGNLVLVYRYYKSDTSGRSSIPFRDLDRSGQVYP